MRLQSVVLAQHDIEVVLAQVTELAAAVVGTTVTACGITMRYDGRPLTVASSDSRAVALDESQYQDGQGPCLHTLSTGEVTDVPDTADETRWAEHTARARDLGLRCSLSLPLAWDATTVGAMNLYGFAEPGMVSGRLRHTFEIFAAQASGSVWLAQRRSDDTANAAQLEEALASRTVIDQALGILMARQSCTAGDAFALLRAASQRENRKLRAVASDLVARTSGSPPEPGRSFR